MTQTRAKLAKMIEQFPTVAKIRSDCKRPNGNGKWFYPKTSVLIQNADIEVMYWEMREVGLIKNSYYSGENKTRGSLIEVVYAVDERDRILESISNLATKLAGRRCIKDVFSSLDSGGVNSIKYIILSQYYVWYKEPKTEGTIVFGDFVSHELRIIVYRKPKNQSWPELLSKSEEVMRQRKEAYKHDPKGLRNLSGIEKALIDGCKLHGFSSGGGLRVIRLEKGKELAGYGEHPHAEEALKICNEDYLAGCKPYNEVYGSDAKRPHYLTGSTECTSNLDCWLRFGSPVDCWREGDQYIFKMSGFAQIPVPENINEIAKREGLAFWSNRGFAYVITSCRFPSGELGTQCQVSKETSTRKDFDKAFGYKITKTGQGATFWKAMISALHASEVEVVDNKD